MNKLFATAILAIWGESATPYNLEAHGQMMFLGFGRSALNSASGPSELLVRLGLDRLDPTHPFNNQSASQCSAPSITGLYNQDAYIDAQANWLSGATPNVNLGQFSRCPTRYEKRSMPPEYTGLTPTSAALGNSPQLRIEGWLMRGVIREDDFQSGKYDNPNLVPDRDPWNDSFRSLNHFYDPIRENTGVGPLGNVGQRSTTWALGVADDAGSWQSNQTPDPSRGNHFSYMDARKLFFLALTYKAPPGGAPIDQSQLRINLWASTFNALGHVVHLLQDTASPQHVRAEPHSFLCNGGFFDNLVEGKVATRTFENFTNYRVTFRYDRVLETAGSPVRYSFSNYCDDEKWRKMFNPNGLQEPQDLSAWNGASGNVYPTPQFSVQRKFFTTRLEDSNPNMRRGLADYTNRGFFTEGAFETANGQSSPDFESPPPVSDASYAPGSIQTVLVPGLGSVEAQTLFWKVPDAVSPNYADPNLDAAGRAPVVSQSLWTNNFVTAGMAISINATGGNLTLDNYTQVADMLAPRAIAYSTGLINFFFRGKLEIEPITKTFLPCSIKASPIRWLTATRSKLRVVVFSALRKSA